MPKKKNKLHFSTKSIHVGNKIDETGAAVTPIHFTSTFKQPTFASTEKYVYSRVGSPTLEALEENLAMLENAKYAYAFSSGMAAMTAIFTMFKPGDHVLISQNVYGGVFRLVTRVLNDNKVDFEFIDTSNVDKVTDSIKDNTKLIHLETPSNPLLDLADIERISKVAHEKNVLVSVDNTFMSPYGQRPLDLGADIVMHSTTKFISGHSDVLSGALMINNDEAIEVVLKAIETAGYRPGEDMYIAMDAAASEFYNAEENMYHFHQSTGDKRTPAEMVAYWENWTKKYPIISIEDGLDEDDWDAWKLLTDKIGDKVQLVGDDLFVTNVDRLIRYS